MVEHGSLFPWQLQKLKKMCNQAVDNFIDAL